MVKQTGPLGVLDTLHRAVSPTANMAAQTAVDCPNGAAPLRLGKLPVPRPWREPALSAPRPSANSTTTR